MSLPPPRRRFGQNFLVDDGAIAWIVARSGEGPVLEIGPGRGALTGRLAARAERLVALELDRDLTGILRRRFADSPSVTITEGDATRTDWELTVPLWFGGGVRPVVVGNLPYNVATPIVRSLFDSIALFPRLVLMFQAEVADRLDATEGEEYGYLSVESRLSVRRIDRLDLPPEAFEPAPKVRSSVLVLEAAPGRPEGPLRDRAFAFASAAFTHRRKFALSNLRRLVPAGGLDRAAEILEAVGIPRNARAEEIPPEVFVSLATALPEGPSPSDGDSVPE